MEQNQIYKSYKMLPDSKSKLYQLDLESAFNLTKDVINIDKDNVEAYRYLSYLYYHFANDYLKAHQLIDMSIDIDENAGLSHKVKGDIYFDEKYFNEAIACYKTAIENSCENSSTLLTQIGNCYKRLNNIELAKQYYQKAIDIDPLAITAIRQLRIIFVENVEYLKVYELWRVDNLIDENTNSTIIEKSTKIQN